MNIGVYASCRNERANLDSWLDSVADADYIAINDTGSTDLTVSKLQKAARVRPNLHVSQLRVRPMQLSNALNIAKAQLPDGSDLIIRVDLDERLRPGWRTLLEHACEHLDLSVPTVLPVWFDHRGAVLRQTRIHTPHGFRWEHPVHELLVPDSEMVSVDVEMTIDHFQDLTKDRSQVLGELEQARAADPDNPRWEHYLGREYVYRADWNHAIPLLRQHAEGTSYPEERSESWRLLADCYYALMPAVEVPLHPYRQAALTSPDRREGWVALAQICYEKGRWPECLEAAERALTITTPHWYLNHPFAWGATPWHLAALASWFLDAHDDARRYGTRAVDLEPDNDLYRANLAWYLSTVQVSAEVRSADG